MDAPRVNIGKYVVRVGLAPANIFIQKDPSETSTVGLSNNKWAKLNELISKLNNYQEKYQYLLK
jgi:hypothetical protein